MGFLRGEFCDLLCDHPVTFCDLLKKLVTFVQFAQKPEIVQKICEKVSF